MRKNILLIIMLLITSFLLSETLRFECDYWAPFNATPDSDEPGFQVEVTKKIFEDAGYEVEYVLIPFTRALQNVASGAAHGTFGLYDAEAEANNLLLPKNNLGVGKTYFYVLQESNWGYDGLSSLENQMLGVIQDYGYDESDVDEYIEENKNTLKVQAMAGDNGLETNIKKLLAGRITVTLEDESVMNWQLKKMGLTGKFKKAGMLDEAYNLYVAFTPTRPELVEIFDKGYEKLEKSCELKKILDKYGVE